MLSARGPVSWPLWGWIHLLVAGHYTNKSWGRWKSPSIEVHWVDFVVNRASHWSLYWVSISGLSETVYPHLLDWWSPACFVDDDMNGDGGMKKKFEIGKAR